MTEITVRAGSNDRLARETASGLVGRTVPVDRDGVHIGEATVVGVDIAEDGTVEMTFTTDQAVLEHLQADVHPSAVSIPGAFLERKVPFASLETNDPYGGDR